MPTCETCRHSRRTLRGNLHCAHPDNCLDMLTGEPEMHPCHAARHHMFGICGPEAALYEEAPPQQVTTKPPTLWQRLAALARRVWPW